MFAEALLMAMMLGAEAQAAASADGRARGALSGTGIEQLHQIDLATIGRPLREIAREADIDTTHGQPAVARVPPPGRAGRVRDSLVNGTAVGAAIGGATALVLMAQACRNNNCSDVSASLDPRFTSFGAAIGAGIGALVDSLIQKPGSVGRIAEPAIFAPPPAAGRPRVMFVAHAGRGQVSDDEGGLGGGGTVGAGVRIPVGLRTGLQFTYDRQKRARDFEFGRRFSGTEQLLMGRMLWFFRNAAAVRPYVGGGIGFIESRSVSESPTFSLGPRFQVMTGGVERHESRSRGMAVGFSAGIDARITRHLSLLSDLTIDIEDRRALASTRLTVGAGWRF